MSTEFVPTISFPGTARDALTFYAEVFGGTTQFFEFGEFAGVAEDSADAHKIMHAELRGGAVHLLATDHLEMMGEYVRGNDISLALMSDDDTAARRYWDALTTGGKIQIPLEKQAWGDVYGTCTDKFGIIWEVNIAQG